MRDILAERVAHLNISKEDDTKYVELRNDIQNHIFDYYEFTL